MVARNSPSPQVFERLCSLAEALLPDSVASIMMKDEQGVMYVTCAPSISTDGQLKLGGLMPGPTGGSCGNAVFHNEPTFVVDALTDERCLDTREVFREFGMHSCWSTPINDSSGASLGSFALSSFRAIEPGAFHKQLLAVGAFIIGIILERSKQQQKLEYLAYNDSLTGLANRTTLFKEIEIRAASARESSESFCFALSGP